MSNQFVIEHVDDVNELFKEDEQEFSLFLNQLPEKDKILFISAFAVIDRQVIKKYIKLSYTQEKLFFNLLEDENDGSQNIRKLIQRMLLDPNSDETLPIGIRKKIFSSAMGMIPDSEGSLWAKRNFCTFMDEELDGDNLELRVAYSESVKSMTQNKFSGAISLSEYKTATQHNLDQSEFIILTVGLLNPLMQNNELMKEKLNQVRKLYLDLEYDKALVLIKEICDVYKDDFGEKIINMIERQTKLSEVTLDKNNPRRFFENRVAALHQGLDVKIDSINKITEFLLGTTSQSVDEVNAAILSMAEFFDLQLLDRMDQIKKISDYYNNRIEKIEKKGFVSKFDESTGVLESDSVYSRNLGIMKSSQPNYVDELSENLLRNSPSDIYSASEEKEQLAKQFYQVPFVASVSGHAFFMIAMLEKYLIDYNQDNISFTPEKITELNVSINNLIQTYVSNYVIRGYHNILEMTAPFNDPIIKELFSEYDVQIDTDFSAKALEYAFLDTQEYTKGMLLKRELHFELKKNLETGSTGFFKKKLQEVNPAECDENLGDDYTL